MIKKIAIVLLILILVLFFTCKSPESTKEVPTVQDAPEESSEELEIGSGLEELDDLDSFDSEDVSFEELDDLQLE